VSRISFPKKTERAEINKFEFVGKKHFSNKDEIPERKYPRPISKT
jgi:hypothetical protein